ncbi:MAG: tRNA epoxyqueuosine(34) reductase QueG [Flavobacteriaceae bacterium]|nr:tRNA epoxyqueuosine(34) reductase QueG [Flavobacteriaceae bacterium]
MQYKSDKQYLTDRIKNEAIRLGFHSCGIARSQFLEQEAIHLEEWLKNGYHGQMRYLENYFEVRLNPDKLVEGAKSVISLLYNYFPSEKQFSDTYKISKYAYGEDYHQVIKKKLTQLVQYIKDQSGDINIRSFVDSAPVMERAWAQKAGLGWIGKHSLLINKQQGSFFFLAEIVLDIELNYDSSIQTDHCGTCTKCIDACPTEAIIPKKTIDASKCISYFTIELRNEIPISMKGKFEDWIFGCDICQDVCPWNRFSLPHTEPDFLPSKDLLSMKKEDWIQLEENSFDQIFKKSAVKRTKYKGLKRNISFLQKVPKSTDNHN